MKDKALHFWLCAIATLTTGIPAGILAGVAFGAGIGIGKEYGDHKAQGNSWSWGDLLADALGVVAGGLSSRLLYYTWFFVSLRMALGLSLRIDCF